MGSRPGAVWVMPHEIGPLPEGATLPEQSGRSMWDSFRFVGVTVSIPICARGHGVATGRQPGDFPSNNHDLFQWRHAMVMTNGRRGLGILLVTAAAAFGAGCPGSGGGSDESSSSSS